MSGITWNLNATLLITIPLGMEILESVFKTSIIAMVNRVHSILHTLGGLKITVHILSSDKYKPKVTKHILLESPFNLVYRRLRTDLYYTYFFQGC
jgi:hypothetical protein